MSEMTKLPRKNACGRWPVRDHSYLRYHSFILTLQLYDFQRVSLTAPQSPDTPQPGARLSIHKHCAGAHALAAPAP